MRKKWLSLTGLLGLVVLLNPDFTHGQPPGGGGFGGKGGKGGKGGFDRGSTFGQGGGPQGGLGGPQGGGPQGNGLGGPPGGGFGGPQGGNKGGGFGGTDAEKAERMFGFFSRGADSIDMNKLDNDQKVAVIRSFERMGMPAPGPTAVIGKQQFVAGATQAMAARAASAGGAPGAPGFGGPPGMGRGPGGPGGNSDAEIESRFREYDLDKDGRISREEASRSRIAGAFEQIDTNRDGFVDLNEYKTYRMNRNGPGGPGGPGGPPGYGPPTGYVPQPGETGYSPERRDPRRDKEKEPELVAVRYGKLPNGLPDWWTDLDTDKDGQIGLYEWRAASRPIAEFREMDLDGDGLLSPAEYFAYEKVKEEKDRKLAAEEGTDRPRSRSGSTGNRPGSGSASTGDSGNSGYRGPFAAPSGNNNQRGPGNRPEGKSDRPDSKGGDRTESGDRPEGKKNKGKGKSRDGND